MEISGAVAISSGSGYGYTPVGLRNIGNTCFMNSIMKKVRHSTFRTLNFPCWNGTIGILNIVTLRNGTRRAFFLSAGWLAVNGNIFVGTRVWVIMYLLRASPSPATWVAPAQLRLSIGWTGDPLAEKIGNSKTNFNPQVLFINCRIWILCPASPAPARLASL